MPKKYNILFSETRDPNLKRVKFQSYLASIKNLTKREGLFIFLEDEMPDLNVASFSGAERDIAKLNSFHFVKHIEYKYDE